VKRQWLPTCGWLFALFLGLFAIIAPLDVASQDILWVRQFGTGGSDGAYGSLAVSNGSVYVASWANGTLPAQTPFGFADAFLRRYASTEAEKWTRQFGTYQADSATGVAATPTPTATASSGSFQPQPPIQAAFFYPWFPKAWTQGSIYPYTNYTPSLGFYDSTDDAVIDEQLRLAQGAHIDAFIASWWGQDTTTDLAFLYILGRSQRSDSPYPDLRWAIYYEQEGQGDPTVAQILADLQYLQVKAFTQPGYLKVGGKPVVFVYASGTDGSDMASRWAQAKAQFGGNVYVVLKVYSGYKSDPNQPDAWHQSAPAVAYDSQLPYSVAVSPGFWKVGELPRLLRDPTTFETNVQRMVTSGAFWQLITTWNEWGEGTSVEPAAEFGTTYLDILCRSLPGSAACGAGGGTPTPTTTPTTRPVSTGTPTETPTPTPTSSPKPTATPVTTAFTFSPAADAYVDASNPSSNYGRATTLRVDASPIVRSYLRFNVTGLNGTVARATLRVYANSASTVGHRVQGVTDNSWGETTITYNNAPAISPTVVGSSGQFSAGVWTTVDVTSLVTGNSALSMAMTGTSTQAISLASRESGSHAPQLVVEVWPFTPTRTPTRTPTPGGTSDPVIAAVGDIACGRASTSASCQQMAVSDLIINTVNPTAVLALGDLQYEYGEYADYTYDGDPRLGYDVSYGRFKDKTYPAIGNHEYGDSVGSTNITPDCDVLQAGNPWSYACGTFDYFNGKGSFTGRLGERGKGYYAVDIGNWRIYAINSNCSRTGAPGCAAGSDQEKWFKADLAAHPNTGKIMIMHHPYLSSDTRNFDYYPQLHDLWQDFYQAGGDLALVGHSHFYERFAPMDPERVADPRGIRQIIVGTGGRNVYGFGTIKPNSEVRIGSTFGALKLTLHPTNYDWQFIDLNGQVLDSGSGPCHKCLDSDNDGVPDESDNCPNIYNPGQENSDNLIGNGTGIPGDDATVPNGDSLGDACDPDMDNDGIPNTSDSDPGGDMTYDDNNNGDPCVPLGTDSFDDGPSWDSNCNGKRDGVEASCPLATNPRGDDDGDGLLNTWEVCKWGTDPNVIDSDGDTLGDCKEAADVDGNRNLDFTGDVIAYAQAILLSTAAFGQDGDFDIDGNNNLDFTGDFIEEANRLLTGICE
jgi:hypothetical protein